MDMRQAACKCDGSFVCRYRHVASNPTCEFWIPLAGLADKRETWGETTYIYANQYTYQYH